MASHDKLEESVDSDAGFMKPRNRCMCDRKKLLQKNIYVYQCTLTEQWLIYVKKRMYFWLDDKRKRNCFAVAIMSSPQFSIPHRKVKI